MNPLLSAAQEGIQMVEEQKATIVVAGFPITADMALKRRGTHFDIPFEVSNHSRDQSASLRGREGTWCYYVTISEQMVSPDVFAKFWLEPSARRERSSGHSEPCYDYTSAAFAGVHWHGGVTYYEKLGGLDGDLRLVKIGCDFAHYWDDGHSYDYADVEREAKQTIDELRATYPFLRRCSWSGKWLPESELIDNGRGFLISKESAAERALSKAGA